MAKQTMYEGNYFSGDVEQYLRKCKLYIPSSDSEASDNGDVDGLQSKSYLEGLPMSQRLPVEKRYAKLKQSFQLANSNHPERTAPYEVLVDIHKTDTTGNGRARNVGRLARRYHERQKLDFSMLRLVHLLSNLNSHIREDLGAVFWAKTKLHVSAAALMTYAPMTFLMDRPAIHKGLRLLELDIACVGFGHFDVELRGQNLLSLTCRYVSTVLQISHLQINLKSKLTAPPLGIPLLWATSLNSPLYQPSYFAHNYLN